MWKGFVVKSSAVLQHAHKDDASHSGDNTEGPAGCCCFFFVQASFNIIALSTYSDLHCLHATEPFQFMNFLFIADVLHCGKRATTRSGLSWFNWWVSFAPEFQCYYFCESSCLFYLSLILISIFLR